MNTEKRNKIILNIIKKKLKIKKNIEFQFSRRPNSPMGFYGSFKHFFYY